MTIKSRFDGFERQSKLATVALSRTGWLPLRIEYFNDPEEGLEEYRLSPEVLARNETIEIGSLTQPGCREPFWRENSV